MTIIGIGYFLLKLVKNNSDRVIDLMIYKNQYILKESLHEILGKHDCTFVYRLCLSSFSSQNALMGHTPRYEQQELAAFIKFIDPYLNWKIHP